MISYMFITVVTFIAACISLCFFSPMQTLASLSRPHGTRKHTDKITLYRNAQPNSVWRSKSDLRISVRDGASKTDPRVGWSHRRKSSMPRTRPVLPRTGGTSKQWSDCWSRGCATRSHWATTMLAFDVVFSRQTTVPPKWFHTVNNLPWNWVCVVG